MIPGGTLVAVNWSESDTERAERRARERRHERMLGAGLTPREVETLEGMARGLSNREIGRELYLEEGTVKTHARRLFRKLQATGRAHAVAIGFREGWLA